MLGKVRENIYFDKKSFKNCFAAHPLKLRKTQEISIGNKKLMVLTYRIVMTD